MQTTSRRPAQSTVAAGLAASAVLLSATLVALGATPLPLLVSVCAAVWLCLLARTGGSLALAVAVVLIGSVGFSLFVLSGLAGRGLATVQTCGLVVLGLGAATLALLRPAPLHLQLTRARLALLGSLTGPAVWLTAWALASRRDSSFGIAWVMSGDARSNFLGARAKLVAGGPPLGEIKLAPLTQSYLAYFIAPGRSGADGVQLLVHDLSRIAQAWSAFIVVGCFFTGLLAGILTRSDTPVTRLLATSGASVLPLSWFVLGPALENGFTNVSLALAIAGASWVIVAQHHKAPAIAALALAGSAGLLLTTWYPLALLPAGMLLAVLAREASASPEPRAHRRLYFSAMALTLAAIGALVVFPLISKPVGDFLAMEGGIYPLPHWAFLITACLALALAASNERTESTSALLWATAVSLVACLAMLGVMLLLRHNAGVLMWGYYPVKYAGMLASAFAFLLVSLLAAMASRAPSARSRMAAILAVTVATAALTTTLVAVPGSKSPVRFLVDGWGGPNGTVVDQVIAASERGPDRVLWNYYDAPNDRIGNFWLTVASATRPDTVGWSLAYDPASLGSLCALGQAGSITAVTRDQSLEESLEQTCPDSSVSVEVIG